MNHLFLSLTLPMFLCKIIYNTPMQILSAIQILPDEQSRTDPRCIHAGKSPRPCRSTRISCASSTIRSFPNPETPLAEQFHSLHPLNRGTSLPELTILSQTPPSLTLVPNPINISCPHPFSLSYTHNCRFNSGASLPKTQVPSS
uniref:Uncharacterized protein n=1 Tax=Physcomitrium patens TaxID=3218 RepID=A0A2K1IFT7_PHYPA|nr:hypothetical protein PHYPA_028729 [Physcomitrium patens]